MKKYKQILAGLLAMNLAVYVMPTGMLQISASVQDQNNEDTDKEETETDITDSQQTQSAGIASETNVFEEGSSDDSTDISEDVASDSTVETPENITVESPEESQSSNETSDFTDSSESSESAEDIFSDGGQLETEDITSGEEFTTQAAESNSGNTIDLNSLKGYDKDRDTFTAYNSKELILLSYCAADAIKNITINLQISGDIDLLETNKINNGDNISDFFKDTITTNSMDEELQADTENAENSTSEQDVNLDSQNNISVQTATVTASQDYTFQGIGTESVPFQGTIVGSVNAIKIDHTFFGGLSSKVTVNLDNNVSVLPLTWFGNETMAMVAGVYQFDSAENTADGESGNNHTLPVKVTGDATGTMGSLIDTVQKTDTVTDQTLIIGDVVDYSNAGQVKVVLSGNAGLICNTLKSGNISLRGYNFPQKVNTIQSTAEYNGKDQSAAGNAGGLIGVMKKNTTLKIESAVTIPDSIEITSDNGNAGGLVGLMEQNSKIVTAENAGITLKTPKIKGGVSAGGVVGTATDVTFTDSDLISAVTVDNPTVISTGTVAGATAGGFVGEYILEAKILGESAGNLQLSNQIVITTPTLTVSNNGLAGGYFGHLNLNGKVSYTVSGADSNSKKEISPTYESCNAEAVGAIVGKVTSDTIESTFLIQNMSVQVTNSNDKGIRYHGGLIGEVGDDKTSVYTKTKDVDITVDNPSASNGDDKYGFGGLAGRLASGSILVTENAKISTTGNISRGGGLVGCATEKSVLEISGETDLSGTNYAGNIKNVGWLVGYLESALIYAKGDGNGNGWTYKRGTDKTNNSQLVNDLGSYGQVVRLHSAQSGTAESSKLSNDLIRIDEQSHAVTYKTALKMTGTEISISSEDDFALLSIAWNTRGYFSADTSLTNENWETIRRAKITLSSNIVLTGSGIAGLTRDSSAEHKEDPDTFKGEFDGNKKTLTLAIGETFGYKGDTLATDKQDGCGKVCTAGKMHRRQGLFAKLSDGKVSNLTVDGEITISNAAELKTDIIAGGIAAVVFNNVTISAVTATEKIHADCTAITKSNSSWMIVGGLFGKDDYETGMNLTLTNVSASSEITINSTANMEETNIFAGGILGQIGSKQKVDLTTDNVTIGGSITTNETKDALIGGLVGIITRPTNSKDPTTDETNRTIKIKNVNFRNFRIEAENVAERCGGLLGSIWATVDVTFSEDSNTGLTVVDSEINAPKAASVGGLAYRSSGIWKIQDEGIDMQSLTINAGKDVGLLVCRGEKNETDKVDGSAQKFGALYLGTTKYWDDAYKISEDGVNITVTNSNGAFDEFVAYTTASAGKIVDNNQNGIISIATKTDSNGNRVGVDAENTCTTYQNRTLYGKSHNTNSCSRYYYDLDWCMNNLKVKAPNSWIDTPEELLLWSVYNYVCQNIKNYFYFSDKSDANGRVFIGNDLNSVQKTLDMRKYSYYPIKYSGSMNIYNVVIKFNNEEIESVETNQKSTQGVTAGGHSQHYTMHCGLILNCSSKSRIYIQKVVFGGSIGKINNETSGVFIADSISGYASASTTQDIIINVNDLKFDNLKVNNCGNDYAPLFINKIGDYVTLNANTISTKVKENSSSYSEGTAVASSLIGTVGSSTGKKINLSFTNITLPDKKADGTNGIFSHATLLESFAYDKERNDSGATYTFYKTDDWNEDEHKHEVTYGKEITASTEFTGIQKYYYDESTYETRDGLVYEATDNMYGFDASAYLPYVYTAYNVEKSTHEIKVNQRVIGITNGCGTYGHPYRITKEAEMNILSNYMATGQPNNEWRVTITGNQGKVHGAKSETEYTSTEDVTYQYNSDKGIWEEVKNNKGADGKDNWQKVSGGTSLNGDFMLKYLLNAYYDIEGLSGSGKDELVLNNFKGFGTDQNPFRGVLMSKHNTKIILQGEETGNGFIPYSYGSVVKNLSIVYRKSDMGSGKTLIYNSGDNKNTPTYYPKVCFGGVIGCVLGGDNIIDGVTVTMDEGWKLTLSGNKSHLIQVGGYIGSVSGGGVIFRNMTGKNGLTKDDVTDQNNTVENIVAETSCSNLYVNPYVGRVLDGFAFYESESKDDKLENTDKNYRINTLVTTDTGCVEANNNTVTVNDAQGLLVLSAVVNSGAGSGGSSNAYSKTGNADGEAVQSGTTDGKKTYYFAGKYGKVRNASYKDVGEVGQDASNAVLAESDDMKIPQEGNLPYLISKYCNSSTKIFGISTNSEIEINLSANNKTGFDMSTYGNGYQGISARYVSNAIRKETTSNVTVNYPEGIVLELNGFNGNNKTVTMNQQVREYTDDDFHAASAGGVFNILRVSLSGKIQNLNIGQEAAQNRSTVSITYYNKSGEPKDIAKTDWSSCKDVGVGGFIGSLVGYTDGNGNRDITIERIKLNGLNITSPASAGGIVGNSGKATVVTDKSNSRDMAVLLQPLNGQIAYGTAFNDCSYSNIAITGKYTSGGFVGYIGTIQDQDPRSSVNGNGFTGTLTSEKIGADSQILGTDKSSWAGGLFGYIGTRIFINMEDTGTKKETQAVLQNVSVSAGTAAGGCIGYINEKCYGIHNVVVKGADPVNGIKTPDIVITGNATGTFWAGGVVGYAKGTAQSWTENWTYAGGISGSSIENVQINTIDISNAHDYNTNQDEIKTNYIAGGIVGWVGGGVTKMDGCTVTSDKIYGSVAGGITGQTDSLMQFSKCVVKGTSKTANTELKGFSTAGGILGFWNGGQAVTIQDCEIQYLDIEGKDWGVGALVGDADSKNNKSGPLYLFNCSARDSKVTAAGDRDNEGGRWPCVGNIIGNLRNTIKASNILISNMTLGANDGSVSTATQGLLFGNVESESVAVNVAGISIQNIPDSNKTWVLTGKGNVTSGNDYIAFADYSGTASDTSAASQTVKDKVTTEVASPYVVTSPKNSTLKLYESESDTNPKYLYGDGVSWSNGDSASFTVKAQEIYKNRKSVTNGHYAYREIPKKTNADGTEIEFDFTSALSTFNTNNPTVNGTTDNTDQTTPTPSENADADQTTEKVTDFPVLQIGAGSADTVTDYLDILTNGAFSAANNLNKEGDIHVTAQSSIYEYKGGKFIKATDTKEKPAAFKVDTDSNGKITFSTTANYDNTQNRFNLLTVTFTEKDADGTAHHYNVFVPVLVRRMLEIDFKASLTYGTDFKNTDYDERTTHVLESFGSSITGYLTYTYNSAKGTYVDYGWESYINAGGNVMEMKKSIRFEQSTALPEGTQLSLVDCRDGRVYYYTATGTENRDGSGINIPLSKFENSEGEAYQEPSISELIGAKAETTGNKLFVKVDINGKPIDKVDEEDKKYPKPTVKIGADYYRLAVSDETPGYSITVNEKSLKNGTKSNVKENYYLVITVPKSATGSMNGSIQTYIDTKIPKQINYRTIKLENNKFMEDVDKHGNTASTYQLSSGYSQILNETGNRGINCKLSMLDSKLTVDVTDTITFLNSQIYNDNDELYVRFVGGMQKTMGSSVTGTSQAATSSAVQFPSGTTGTANFYVYTEKDNKKTYYTYVDGLWESSGSEEQIAVSYPWTSAGGNMELPLSTDGTTENVISLQNLRKQLKTANSGKSTSTFYIQVKMDAIIPGAGLDVIPESKTDSSGSPEDYVKLTYYSQLSTESQSLTYSSNRATLSQTTTAYYQDAPSGAKLTYDADKIDQLGINLLDLQSAYLDAEEKNTYIDTTATYDLSAMKNLKDTLKNSTGIKFTLSLVPKNTTGRLEEYGSQLTDADKYLDVTLRSQDSGEAAYTGGTWSWTVPKTSYYDDASKQIITSSVFDGSKLRQAIRLKVNVTNVEDQSHFYSNYKVVLTADIMNRDQLIAGTHKDDNIIYTLAKINMEFQDQ